MNASTGVVMELPDLKGADGGSYWPDVGQPILPSDVPSYDEIAGEEHAPAIAALREAVYAGEPLVMVSDEVAQQMQLGARELERRKRRRRAAKASRKRNR